LRFSKKHSPGRVKDKLIRVSCLNVSILGYWDIGILGYWDVVIAVSRVIILYFVIYYLKNIFSFDPKISYKCF